MSARIARASSPAATHTSGTSELVSPACVPDLTYTHMATSFFGAGALCLRAVFSCFSGLKPRDSTVSTARFNGKHETLLTLTAPPAESLL